MSNARTSFQFKHLIRNLSRQNRSVFLNETFEIPLTYDESFIFANQTQYGVSEASYPIIVIWTRIQDPPKGTLFRYVSTYSVSFQ